MKEYMNCTRRELLALGTPALAGALLCPNIGLSAEEGGGATALSEIQPEKPWSDRRKEVERRWLDLLGDFPTEIPKLRPEMKEVAKDDGITRYHVTFQAEHNDRVTAWLLVPDAAREKPTPAIICIHSTTFGSGKDSTIGLSGRRAIDPPRDPKIGAAYGLELARHGFVTLSIDLLTDGERIHPGKRVMDTRRLYLEHPEWSIVGKNTWDIMRSVDFLRTLDFVDQKHIGCTGWSLGGHTALFGAAFDPRITATISNGASFVGIGTRTPYLDRAGVLPPPGLSEMPGDFQGLPQLARC
jgi:dienelactone hydrolase